jgi:glutamate-ammonia-ligase adenylyltransferase
VVVGGAGLAEAVERFRRALILEKGRGAQVISDAAAMRARLLAAWPAPSDWEAKTGPGRLMDIEFLAQTAALMAGDPQCGTDQQLRAGRESGFLSVAEAEILLAAWRLFWTLRAAGRLLTERDLGPEGLGQGGCAFLLRETGAETASDLTLQLRVASEAAAAVIGAKLAWAQGDGEMRDADDRG